MLKKDECTMPCPTLPMFVPMLLPTSPSMKLRGQNQNLLSENDPLILGGGGGYQLLGLEKSRSC